MKTTVALLFVLCIGPLLLSAQSAPKHRLLFNRFRVAEIELMIADADGSNARPVVDHHESEYSPSLSLNGAWVAFTSERSGQPDIFRAHLDGSGVQQLTDDPAFDDQGALSPDGALLAFVSTRGNGHTNIWLLDIASKRLRNLTNSTAGNFRPAWSPDGKWIAFSSDRDSHPGALPSHWEHLQSTGIYVMKPDGTGLRRLTRAGGVAGSPAWSADGKRILFYETDEVGAYLSKFAPVRSEIASVDVTTGERKVHTASNETKLSPQWLPGGKLSYIVRSGNDNEGLKTWNPDRSVVTIAKGMVRHPVWTADGKRVVYERYIQPGYQERMIPTFSRDPEFELFLNEPFPSFSPDGKKLLYSAQARNGLDPQNTSIEMMNADGTGVTTLFTREGYSAFNAVFSPTGDEIALSVGKYFRAPGLPAAPIALIKPDGSGYREIVDDGVNNGFPSWSPDGKKLVYKHGKQLVILTLADNKTVPLTDGSHYDNFPEWSPKGDLIMFTSDRSGDFELYTVRTDGTGVRQLTDTPGMNAHSVWSPDGEWIAFTSGRMGFKDEMAMHDGEPQPYGEIFAMRANGTDVRQLTDNKWEDATVTWAPEPKTPTRSAAARR